MSSLFIGLGGFGARTLGELNKIMDVYNENLAEQDQPQVSAHYYYIDTERRWYVQHPELFIGSSNKTFHQIGQQSPDIIVSGLQRAGGGQCEFLTKWYDAPSKSTNLCMGSDVIRQYARLAFAAESTSIRHDLYPLIQKVTASQGRIYVITGSCGGTGSGIYMDILYLISEIYADLNTSFSSSDVRFIMAMPEGYLDGRPSLDWANMKMRLNAFATLEELNAICKDKESNPSKFNGCYVGDLKKRGVFQPFRFGYLYDTAWQNPSEASQKLSTIIFELEFPSCTANGIAGCRDYNGSFFDGLLTGTVDGNWNSTFNHDYVKAFNALGRYTIEKPDFLYRRYFTDRLLYDVFHEGLIGKKESVNEEVVIQYTHEFIDNCSVEISKKHEAIKSLVTESDFENDFMVGSLFSVFTGYPNMHESIVKQIVRCKNELLTMMRTKVSEHCKAWMKRYGLATTYAILDALDTTIYAASLQTYHEFDDLLAQAKKNSMGGLLKKRIKPEKAMNEFGHILHTWLSFEVHKALSSGVEITDQEHGYLDYGKEYVEHAMRNLELNEEQEHWEIWFCKEVARLKYCEDRSFVPTLNTITDNNGRIIPDSLMVAAYENTVLADSSKTDFSQGICTPQTFHERIMAEMMTNSSLKGQDFDLNNLFDPESSFSLHIKPNATKFVEYYLATAKQQIDILLDANQSYQQLFAGDILSRLQNLPMSERAMICRSFADYERVQLRTQDMYAQDLTSYTYYLISSTTNVGLMQELGILDQNGNKQMNSDHTPFNPFFSDKIVKLIVKNGFSINDYRYYDEYKEYALRTLVQGMQYDPFIDKRFLGELDQDGEYPCDVSAALDRIATETN